MPSQTIAGERAAAARHRRPGDAGDRDGDRDRHRQPDEDVERPARPIGDQDQAGRHQPARDEGDPDQPKLELADPHVFESSGAPVRKYRARP